MLAGNLCVTRRRGPPLALGCFFLFLFFFFQIHQIVLRHQRFFSAFCLGLKRIGFQACMECLPRAIYDLIYLAVIFLPCMYGFNKTSYSCLFAIFLDSSVMYLSCI